MPSSVALHAELLGLAGGVGDLGGVQQRLGRDAADVQAGAAELALLDQADATARAGRPAARRRSRRSPPRGSSTSNSCRRPRWSHPLHVCRRRPPIVASCTRPVSTPASGPTAARVSEPHAAHWSPWVGWTGSAGRAARMRRPRRRRAHRLDDACARRTRADEQHLREFVATRRGVEGFVEPRTAVSDVTLLLVAHDGEWTRRRVPSVEWAHSSANRHGVPSYDAARGRHPAADARVQPAQAARQSRAQPAEPRLRSRASAGVARPGWTPRSRCRRR